MRECQLTGYDTLLIDTAGRLHIDEELMTELQQIKQETVPSEILFIADAMTGQDAVRSAQQFHERIGLTGVVLTKMEGDTSRRRGAFDQRSHGPAYQVHRRRRALRRDRVVLS